jgi:hypothetical protein
MKIMLKSKFLKIYLVELEILFIFHSSYCLNHIFFEKLKSIKETSANDGKYKLIKDPNYELDSFNKGPSKNSLFLLDNNMLSEPKFLLKDTLASKRRTRRKRMQKLKTNNKFNGASAAKKNKLNALNVDNGEDSEGDDADDSDNSSENNNHSNEYNEMDLDLLDSSDSLDQTMFNIIKAKQANDNQLVKKYSLKQNPETNEYVLVVNDEHDLNESDTQLSVSASNANSKLIDKNIEQDYDSLLR